MEKVNDKKSKKKPSCIQSDSQLAERRKKLLSFVGMGHDTATDVAEHHDEYYAEAIWEHLKRARRKDIDTRA